MAYKRRKLGRKENKRVFRKGTKVRGKNLRAMPMRGGWRL